MTMESWNGIPQTIIVNGFKHLYSSSEEIELNLLIDQFDDEDNIPNSNIIQNYNYNQ